VAWARFYRARDTKLKRDVALKVLPEAFARDPERMARFQREAEVLASLNHPNIAAIRASQARRCGFAVQHAMQWQTRADAKAKDKVE
jgi:serine/threonine protein kinase